MKDIAYAPVCGIYCGDCHFLGKECTGCGHVAGRPFWTSLMPDKICPLHDCCSNQKKLEHCGCCPEFPCQTFNDLRDPNMTDEEFNQSLTARKTELIKRTKIGTDKWLQEKTSP